jgi:hypothetical protein
MNKNSKNSDLHYFYMICPMMSEQRKENIPMIEMNSEEKYFSYEMDTSIYKLKISNTNFKSIQQHFYFLSHYFFSVWSGYYDKGDIEIEIGWMPKRQFNEKDV